MATNNSINANQSLKTTDNVTFNNSTLTGTESFPNADGDKILLLGASTRAKIVHNSGFEVGMYAGSTAGNDTGVFNWYTINGAATFTSRMSLGNTGLLTLTGGISPTFTFASYSPTIGDGTNNFTGLTSIGQSTTMGNMTFFTAWIQWTGKGSASGNIRISLPSTTNSASERYPLTCGILNGIGVTTQRMISCAADNNVAYAWLFKNTTGTVAILQDTDFATAGEVQIGGWYRT